jgi:hypothetical protein
LGLADNSSTKRPIAQFATLLAPTLTLALANYKNDAKIIVAGISGNRFGH